MGILTCCVAGFRDGDLKHGDPRVDGEIDEDVPPVTEFARMGWKGQRVGVDEREIAKVHLLASLIV